MAESSLDTVGFRTLGGRSTRSRVLNPVDQKSDRQIPKCAEGVEGGGGHWFWNNS